jgi:translation initiation factor eIF-2B subunit delta
MVELSAELRGRISRLAGDRMSGASEILSEAVAILDLARERGEPTRPVVRGLCRAHPSMASIWNAGIEALAAEADPLRFDRFVQRLARASGALARFARECFSIESEAGPLSLVTLSFSKSVVTAVEAIRQVRPVRVSCSEGRPALEGRRMALEIASLGVPVMSYGDAAVGHALATADAVLVGADAITPDWFLNKSGTRMLAAAALQKGIPVYVAATRDKFVSQTVGTRLVIRDGSPQEIWDTPPPGVDVRNPYFEPTPLDLVTTIITDFGLLGAGMVPEVCESMHEGEVLRMLDEAG